MGEVYRAVDTTLGREVAIKVLPTAFASDAERLARFEREARLLASINHPNIAAVYGLHELGGNRFLAMELVPGEDLAQRLERGALAVDEALAIARQIADALAAAHEQGVVHRDLKPANVQVTADGRVKVLDFGLAKGLDAGKGGPSDLALSPTLTFGATIEGVILGTAAYMSPEQARGRAVDRRADVWAFGCVLWEMLTGRRLFGGETVSDTIAAVLRAEPEWNQLPEETPAAVRRLLRRCLERDPAKRLRDLGDARLELDELGTASATPAAAASPSATAEPNRTPWMVAGIAVLLALAAISWAVAHRAATPPAAHEPAIRFSIADPPLAISVFGPRLAIAPDGSRLYWVAMVHGQRVLMTRAIGALETQEVSGSEGIGGIAAVAPDGSSAAMVRGSAIEWLALRGGAPDRLAHAGVFRGAALADDGALWFSPSTEAGIVRVGRAGGDPVPVVLPDAAAGERSFRWPTLLPGGEVVLFTVATAEIQTFAEARIEAYSTRTKRRTVVVERASYPLFLAPDRLFFVRSGGLFEVRLDVERLAVIAEPKLVQDGVADDSLTGLADIALAKDGTLAYAPGGVHSIPRRLLEVSRDGTTRAITAEADPYQRLRASPDGKTLAVDIDAAGAQLWLIERDRGTRVRLTNAWSNNYPVWSRDGQAIYFLSARGTRFHIWVQRLEGGAATSLLESDSNIYPLDVSPDGKRLLYTQDTESQRSDLLELALDGSGPPRAVVASPYGDGHGRYSPDGRWLAFTSDESGRQEIYLQPLPGPGRKLRVSTDGGTYPLWSPDGREIVYSALAGGDELFAARVALGADASVERPHLLARLDGPIYGLEMLPDGKLVVVLDAPATATAPLVVARGWDRSPTAPPQP
jgi:hypothetical protein